ncbi:MAG: esterase [Firmicutes bacterium]|nr:esterase [Bacillota bacterium]
METRYMTHYSGSLGREMEFKVYGHSGKPVVFVPCQGGRFWDFESFGMAQVFEPWIAQGICTVYSVDPIDNEAYADLHGDKRRRIERHEQWIHYVTEEFIPMVNHLDWERNGYVRPITIFGASMGAMHAANLFFRRPELFDGVLALSGLYDPNLFFGDYRDELIYQNSPSLCLANMPWDHPYIGLYNERRIIICVGQGAWEDELLASTRWLESVLRSKDIHATVDYWGYDVNHDWDWWFRQVRYYMPRFFE